MVEHYIQLKNYKANQVFQSKINQYIVFISRMMIINMEINHPLWYFVDLLVH